jgi:glycosyltransferase involved in cell wall biosynthesis
MKLAIQNTSKVWGGNEKWLAAVGEGLIARGHDVVVSCAPGPVANELAARGIGTTTIRPRGAIDLVSAAAFGRWLRHEKPDTLLLTSWRVTPWAVVAARLAGIQRMVMRLGIVRDFPRNTPKAIALEAVQAIIVNSSEIRDVWLRTAPRHLGTRATVVLNGVRSRRGERETQRAKLRTELGLSGDTILVGGAGHISARKGFDLLLRALAQTEEPDIMVAIVGDGEYRSELERVASDLGIPSRVKWLGHRDDGAGVITAFDIFVLSSHNEGMANVMLEAMAGGVPVIAFDVSGVSEAIGEREGRPAAGWIIPSADVDALARALDSATVQLRTNPSAVEAISDEAHWRAENWFSPARMVAECEVLLFPE